MKNFHIGQEQLPIWKKRNDGTYRWKSVSKTSEVSEEYDKSYMCENSTKNFFYDPENDQLFVYVIFNGFSAKFVFSRGETPAYVESSEIEVLLNADTVTEIPYFKNIPTLTPEENSTGVITREEILNGTYTNNENEVDPDFKDSLDAYEKFMDEYIAFMQLYKENPSNTDILLKYVDFMSKYAEFMTEIDGMDTENMTDEEYEYYIDVTTRVSAKLMKAAIN